jgi:hypothetical protein
MALALANRRNGLCSHTRRDAFSVCPGRRRGSKGRVMKPGVDLPLQRVFDRVELVSGIGDPDAGKLCIMSLVACLAGERHTDHPSCASPTIRAFAIPVNDHMPRGVRQRLKLFAPRILGTNDGLDNGRAEILRRALTEELLPHAVAQWQASSDASGRGPSRRLWAFVRRHALLRRIARLQRRDGASGDSGDRIALASAAAQLLVFCALGARDAGEAERTWSLAIGLLDRLCDVGASHRPVRDPLTLQGPGRQQGPSWCLVLS